MKKILFISILSGLLFASCAKDEINIYGGIYGTVRDADSGSLIYNAEITLQPGHPSPVTGTNGAFEFNNLEARQYKLSVRANGYIDDSRQVTVVAGESTQCDILMTKEREIEGMSVSTAKLDFGSAMSNLSITLANTGNQDIAWTISMKSNAGWLTVSPMSGTTAVGKSSDVVVSVNRSLITEDDSAIFLINAAGGSKSVLVTVSKNDNSGNNGGGSGGNVGTNVTNGLYAYYMFENNCNNAVDGAPNGQGINNPSYTDGVKGQAVKLSVADDSYINIPEAMIDSNTFSISFWIKGLSDGHLFHVPSDKYSTNSYENGFILTMQNGRVTFWSGRYWYYKSYNEVRPFTHPTIDSSVWNMITLTMENRLSYDSKAVSAKLYINGEYVDVVDISIDCIGTGTKFVFGGKFETATPPSMTVDNLRIYNSRTLSATEVKQIYNYEK